MGRTQAAWVWNGTHGLNTIMNAVYDQCTVAAEAHGAKGNLVDGANIAGFLKVANAMMAQGVV